MNIPEYKTEKNSIKFDDLPLDARKSIITKLRNEIKQVKELINKYENIRNIK